GKADDAKRLGASEVVVTRNREEVAKHARSFRFILDTVSVAHDLDMYVSALDRDGTLCLVGAPPTPHPSPSANNLIFGRRQIVGSLIGGVPRTREMLEFCGKHGITCDVEVIPIQQVDAAYERMLRSDVKYRFVIDMASIERGAARA
ncbi:MAG TPA: zinc-binding dehydrogenase, partial [Gemmatimonadales bacterium]|nr:zinc-binding dehydrogenase [Gemmatimonadales bacterium]